MLFTVGPLASSTAICDKWRDSGLKQALESARRGAFEFISAVTSLRNTRVEWDETEQAERVAARSAGGM